MTTLKPQLFRALAVFAVLVVASPALAVTAHFDGFENAWSSPAVDPNAPYITAGYPTWQKYNSEINRVPSGTVGITSKNGSNHGEITPVDTNNAPDTFTGAFSRLGGYSTSFGGGFRASLDVYLDLTDSAVGTGTYGWDLSTAANGQDGNHRRDFIFHTAANGAGDILVGGSNNSNFTRRNDLASINHYTVTSSDWFTFEWLFRDAGDNTLAVDLNLRDIYGTLLWTETRNDPTDLISSVVGGNRYMWFTFLETDYLAIDNTRLLASVPEPACAALVGTALLGFCVVRRRQRG
jgi:hypothetical protein